MRDARRLRRFTPMAFGLGELLDPRLLLNGDVPPADAGDPPPPPNDPPPPPADAGDPPPPPPDPGDPPPATPVPPGGP